MIWTRGHHDTLKSVFHGFQNFSIWKALNPKGSFSIFISKAQDPIFKNRVLSSEIEKKIRFLTDRFKWKDGSFYLTNGISYQNSMEWGLLGIQYGF